MGYKLGYGGLLGLCMAVALSGCESMPSSGPAKADFAALETTNHSDITLLDLTTDMIERMASYRVLTLSSAFADSRPSPTQRVGIGDTLSVTIFEAGSGGLFSTGSSQVSAGNKNVTLPPQVIGANGSINVPYVGRIRAAGQSVAEIEAAIVGGLKDKAIEPQVIVTLQQMRSNLVTVSGDVGTPGRIPLTASGDTIMDVIAASGGARGQAGELFIRLTRKGNTGLVPMRLLLEEPKQNIHVWPGDQIYVYREPQVFTAFGASGKSGNFPFDYDRVSLIEAVGSAAGLDDRRADPEGVFLFREERGALVCLLKQESPCDNPNAIKPVIFRVNLKTPEGIVLAKRLRIRNKDVLYIANTDSAQFMKFVSILATIASGFNSGSSAASRVNGWD